MITRELVKFQAAVADEPIEAAVSLHNYVDTIVKEREEALAGLSSSERDLWAVESYRKVSRLAKFLIDNCDPEDRVDHIDVEGNPCVTVCIATKSLGRFALFRDDKGNHNSQVNVFIENDELRDALADLSDDHVHKEDDCLAHLCSPTDPSFEMCDPAEAGWALELLMTIALDQHQPSNFYSTVRLTYGEMLETGLSAELEVSNTVFEDHFSTERQERTTLNILKARAARGELSPDDTAMLSRYEKRNEARRVVLDRLRHRIRAKEYLAALEALPTAG